MQASDITCHASIAGGLMTTECGSDIDLAKIQRALRNIANIEANWNSDPDEIAAALNYAKEEAEFALKQFDIV